MRVKCHRFNCQKHSQIPNYIFDFGYLVNSPKTILMTKVNKVNDKNQGKLGEITTQKSIIHYLTKITPSLFFLLRISLYSFSIKLISLFFCGHITNMPKNQTSLSCGQFSVEKYLCMFVLIIRAL